MLSVGFLGMGGGRWGLRRARLSPLPPGTSPTPLLASLPSQSFLWMGRASICSLRMGTQHGHRAALTHPAGHCGGLGGGEDRGVALSWGGGCMLCSAGTQLLFTHSSIRFFSVLKGREALTLGDARDEEQTPKLPSLIPMQRCSSSSQGGVLQLELIGVISTQHPLLSPPPTPPQSIPTAVPHPCAALSANGIHTSWGMGDGGGGGTAALCPSLQPVMAPFLLSCSKITGGKEIISLSPATFVRCRGGGGLSCRAAILQCHTVTPRPLTGLTPIPVLCDLNNNGGKTAAASASPPDAALLPSRSSQALSN